MATSEPTTYPRQLPEAGNVVVMNWTIGDVERVLDELRLNSRISSRAIDEFEKNDILEDFAHRETELRAMADRFLKVSAIEIIEEYEEARSRVDKTLD
jgi:hypothetical protein